MSTSNTEAALLNSARAQDTNTIGTDAVADVQGDGGTTGSPAGPKVERPAAFREVLTGQRPGPDAALMAAVNAAESPGKASDAGALAVTFDAMLTAAGTLWRVLRSDGLVLDSDEHGFCEPDTVQGGGYCFVSREWAERHLKRWNKNQLATEEKYKPEPAVRLGQGSYERAWPDDGTTGPLQTDDSERVADAFGIGTRASGAVPAAAPAPSSIMPGQAAAWEEICKVAHATNPDWHDLARRGEHISGVAAMSRVVRAGVEALSNNPQAGEGAPLVPSAASSPSAADLAWSIGFAHAMVVACGIVSELAPSDAARACRVRLMDESKKRTARGAVIECRA